MYGLCLGSASRFETAEATPTAKRFSSTQVMVSTVLCGVAVVKFMFGRGLRLTYSP